MADPVAPRLSDYLNAGGSGNPYADYVNAWRASQAQPPAADQYTPTGTGNFLTAGLGAGYHEALGQIGSAGEAAGRIFGMPSFADAAKAWSEGQRQTAATYARPDLEASPWSPAGIGYQLAKGVPAAGGMLGGALVAGALAPEAAAGAVAAGTGAALAYPFSVGSNVQAKEDYTHAPLTRGQAAGAAALGVPEAALFALPAGRLEKAFGAGVAGSLGGRIASGAAGQAAYMAPVSAAQDALTQLMGDPNRTFASRAKEVVNAALGGGLQGAFFGGALGAVRPAHELAKVPTDAVTTPDLDASTAAVLDPSKAPPPAPLALPPPPIRMEPEPGQVASPPLPDMSQMPSPQLFGLAAQLGRIQRTPDQDARFLAATLEMQRRGAQVPGLPQLEYQPRVASAEAIAMPPEAGQVGIPGELIPTPRLEYQPRVASAEPIPLPDETARVAPPTEAAVTAQGPQPPEAAPAPSVAIPEIPTDEDGIIEPDAGWMTEKAKRLNTWVKAQTLRGYVRAKGGLKDPNGDLASMGLDSLIRKKNGLDPDKMRELAAADGFLGADKDAAVQNTTVRDFFDALADHPRYSVHDQAEVERARQAAAYNEDRTALEHKSRAIESFAAKNDIPLDRDLLAKAAELWHVGEADNADGAIERAAIQSEPERGPEDTGVSFEDALRRSGWGDESQGEGSGTEAPPQRANAQGVAGSPAEGRGQAAFEQRIAEYKAQRAKASALVDAAISKDRPNLVLENGDKKIVLSKGLGEYPLRITTFDKDGPSGHRDYKTTDREGVYSMDAEIDSALRDGYQVRGATEVGPQGTRQTLVPGVEPVTDKQRANLAASKPLRGGNAPLPGDSLFSGGLDPELFRKGGLYEAPETEHDLTAAQGIMAKKSFSELMDDVAKISPEHADMAAALKRAGVDVPVRYSTREENENAQLRAPEGQSVKASYIAHDKGDEIRIYSSANLPVSLLHEGVHAATYRALRDGTTTAAKEITRLYEAVKARSPNSDAYGLKNVYEFAAEAFGNPVFRDFLRGEKVATGSKLGDMWQGFKNAVFKMLRMPERARSAFDQVMELRDPLMQEGAEANRLEAEGNRFGGEQPSGEGAPNGAGLPLIRRADEGAKATVRVADDLGARAFSAVRDNVTNAKSNMGDRILEHGMKWLHTDQIAHLYGNIVPSLKDYYNRITNRDARSEASSKVDRVSARMWGDLDKTQRKLMDKVTTGFQYGIDPRKSWEAHSWLHDDPQAAEWRQYHNDRVNDLNNFLRTGPKAQATLDNAIATNEFKMHGRNALLSHMLVKAVSEYDKAIGNDPAFAKSPIEEFVQKSAEHDNPVAAAAWMRDRAADMYGKIRGLQDTFANQASAMKQDMAEKRKAMGKRATKAAFAEAEVNYQNLRTAAENLKSLTDSINDSQRSWERAPNFSLGHGDGNFFAAGKLAVGEDGLASKQTIEAIRSALDKAGFGNISVERLNKNPKIFSRVNTQRQAQALGDVFLGLQKRGFLDKDTTVESGPNKEPSAFEGITPAFAHKIMEVVRQSMPEPPEGASNQDKAEYERQFQDMQRQMLDMLPETSLTRAWTSRKMVQGNTSDMLAPFNKRNANESRGLGSLSSSRDIAAALSGMRDELKGLKTASTPMKQKLQAQRAVEEIMQREAQRQWMLPTPGVDLIQRLTHILEIGISPAYFVTLMSQIPTLSLPELGDKHGYAKASAALMQNAGKTFAVVKAALGGPEASTFGLRLEELAKQGTLSAADRDFIMKFANMGGLNQSAFTSAMTGHHELSEGADRVLNWGSTMSLTSEMIPRIITAFAARDLYNKNPVKGFATPEEYALNAANSSQFDFNPANTPRGFGKHGPLGPMGKLAFQFMGFVTLLSEKMYREMADSFGRVRPGETAADTKARAVEARKWLGGHAAAVAAIAGTMGLPGASMFTGVFDKLADWATGEDSWDSEVAYRGWLAKVFGPQVGEVIARGLPRMAGLDMSHEGEGEMLDRIMPFMQLVTEKRKFEDASDDFLSHMSGSAIGMGRNWILGARDMLNGDYLKGAIKMAPEALRGPLEAGQIVARGGYPVGRMQIADPRLHPGPLELAETALGLDPAGKAEASDQIQNMIGLNAMSQYRQDNIGQHLAMATMRGDQDNMQYWAGQSQAWMQEHPGMVPPIMRLREYINKAMQQQAVSGATGVPVGVNPRNIAERQQLSFGNFAGR